MKTGKTLVELATEVQRQREQKRDFIAPLGRVSMELSEVGNKPVLALQNGHRQDFGIGNIAHQQLAELAGVPKVYYDRMRTDFPELLRQNVNGWIGRQPQTRRMVRTLDGQARAVLSERFRPLDNFDLLEAVLPTLQQHGCDVVSCEVTEARMYVKAILPNLQAEIQGVRLGVGHQGLQKNIVVGAVTISNSEVGMGSLSVMPAVFDTFCTNLAQLTTRFFRKYHVGKLGRFGDGDDINELLSVGTRTKLDEAFFMSVRDVVRGTFSDEGFRAAVASIQEAADSKIESRDLAAVVELAGEKMNIGKDARPSILRHLIERGDLSRWGLASAVTRESADHPDYEKANELEQLGGRIIELPRHEWTAISQAASKN